MGENSHVQWTHHTFNPWWGCEHVSPACANCYAERDARRWANKGLFWGAKAPRRFFGHRHWNEPLEWHRKAVAAGERQRVFCGSMCDVGEPRADLAEHRANLWGLIVATPQLDWLLLSKRPRELAMSMPKAWTVLPSNVWVGVTVEDQKRAEERLPLLLKIPAVVRFVSCEPLLGPVDLRKWIPHRSDGYERTDASPSGRSQGKCKTCGRVSAGFEKFCRTVQNSQSVRWIIVGAESGPKRRPMHEDWVVSLRDQCVDADIPFFYKQRAESKRMVSMPLLGGRQWDQLPNPQ